MPTNINKLLQEFIEKVKSILGDRIVKIILYGSYARVNYKKDSDVDLMILTNLTDEEIIKYRTIIWEIASEIEIDTEICISPLIKNIDKYNYWVSTLPFYINIEKEGVVLSEQ